MIARFGLPGSSLFSWRHVATRSEGEAWLDAHLSELGESQGTLSARRQSDVLTEKEAANYRWQDGTKIYSDPAEHTALEVVGETEDRAYWERVERAVQNGEVR